MSRVSCGRMSLSSGEAHWRMQGRTVLFATYLETVHPKPDRHAYTQAHLWGCGARGGGERRREEEREREGAEKGEEKQSSKM